MKRLILLIVPALCVSAYLITFTLTRDRESALLQSVTFSVDQSINEMTVDRVLEEKASTITNRLDLGYTKLKTEASAERNSPTLRGKYFVGWDIRPSNEKRIYSLITYTHTNLAETTNGAWVGALASRTAYVRLQP